MSSVEIRNINWQDTMSLRHRILWPDKPPEYCRVEEDPVGHHFGAFINNKLVCVASVYIDHGEARLRKFATETEFQGQGIGSKMLYHVFAFIKQEKVNYFWLGARESAMALYQRFGMAPEGERFYKGDIPYYKMSINLE